MEASNKNWNYNCSRRDFMKYTALGAAAVSVVGSGLIQNAGAASMSHLKTEEVETDVLVIGGGHAGTFAAMKAKDAGLNVTLTDKGTVGRSGKSPWSVGFSYRDSSSKESLKSILSECDMKSGYLVRKDYVEMWFNESKARYDDLSSWGALKAKNHGDIYKEQLLKNNVRLIERTMIAELLIKNGRVIGAIGFPMEEDKAIIIHAKAVVMCSGSGAFKIPGYVNGCLTHDGQAMAYNAGAEISGKENVDTHATLVKNICNPWAQYGSEFDWTIFPSSSGSMGGPPPGAEGLDASRPSGTPPQVRGGGARPARVDMHQMALAAHEGKVPVTPQVLVGGPASMGPNMIEPDEQLTVSGTIGMATHRYDGIFPKLNTCTTGVEGLFAAGDSVYAAIGMTGASSAGSTVQGARAGIEAAEYVGSVKKLQLSKAEIKKVTDRVFSPRSSEKGYSPAWVTQTLQSIMAPYYVLYIKKEDRLKAALTNIEFLRDHFAPKLLANDTHELRLAHETKNMLLNAEMMLRTSLFRTESRGTHYREDFPKEDDKNWLAWVIISKEGDSMKLTKRSIPEEWKPS